MRRCPARVRQHAGVRPAPLLAAVLVAVSATACGAMDEAELVDPGAVQVTAEPGQLRVLRHHDDPGAGDDWRTVLPADADVVAETGRFREADSRHAGDDEAADVRLLYEGVAEGRTVLVQVNCRGCEDGVPATDPDSTGILVWDFVVGGGRAVEPTLGRAAAREGETQDMARGEHVVVVRGPDDDGDVGAFDTAVLRRIARHVPADGSALSVDVFAAVGPGATTLAYGSDEYRIRVG